MKRKNVYLSVQGSDAAGDGSRKRPVATLAQVVVLSRQAGSAQCRIVAGDGIYFDTNAALTAADSGLEIVAAKGAKPAFYGGIKVGGWRAEGSGSPFWVASIPGVGDGSVDFRSLVINDRFAPRARYPQTGEILHASSFPVKWMSTTKGGWERKPTEEELTTLKVVAGSLPDSLSLRNAELTIYHSWDESLVGIKQWDRKGGVITFSAPAGHPAGAFGEYVEKARTFAVWNVREGMTEPGQWYLDRDAGQIVYWPLAGETLAAITAYAPVHTTVLRLEGTEAAPVKDVRLKGLTFGVTTTRLLAGGFGAGLFEGALEGKYAHGLSIEDVTARWTGGQGMRISNSDNLRCINCTIYDVGAGGAIFNNGKNGAVSGALIHHNGRTYPSALALRVSGKSWRVHHNTLHHTPYSAICGDGTDLRIEHNRFHHVMQELSDGAAIYLSAAKACVIRGNYTHDLPDKQVHAYYLDEQSADSLVAGNVALGVPWPIHNHMAWSCIVRDNVCIYEGNMRLSFPNCDQFSLQRNVFACSGELIFETSYTGVSMLKNNACFSQAGQYRFAFHDRLPSLERNTTATQILPANKGSVMADSGCQCADGKISYTNVELVKKLGLRAIDVSDAGCGRE